MKRLIRRIHALMPRITVRFVTFYLVLVLLPTLVFINAYANNLHRQAINEQRAERQTALLLSTQYFTYAMDEVRLVADTLQSSTPLLTLLSGGYPSAADELYAYSAYIQPLLESVYAIRPALDALYLYRIYPSHISNSGLVYNFCDYQSLPYDYDEADNNRTFLATSPGQYHHPSDEADDGARVIHLCNLYSRDYAHVVAVLELQLSMDELLSSAFPVVSGGELFLGWDGVCYPIVQQEGKCHLDMAHPLTGKPEVARDEMLLEETMNGLTFLYRLPLIDSYGASKRFFIQMLLLLIVPMAIFWLYILFYTHVITRFSRHIHLTGTGMPKPYGGPIYQDEFGDVVREYNAMTKTIAELIDSVQEAERLKNAANYYAMSSQVNPHFMFNTLENIRMHIELEKYDDANQMLFSLSRFLRYNISMREESSLEAELEHTRYYVRIYQYRIQHMIHFDIRKEEDVTNIPCPVRILQPIVENSFKHGIAGLNTPIHVEVYAHRCEGGVMIEVTDDGSGMSDEALGELNARMATATLHKRDQANDHVGLDNVNARIKYYYGAEYGLSFVQGQPTGVRCRMYVGLEKQPSLKGGSST